MVLRIVNCSEHDNKAVYLNGALVFQDDCSLEALLRVAKHLGWKVVHETLNFDEFERRYA